MGFYYRTGKAIYHTNTRLAEKISGEQTLIADCEDEEKAHFIVNRLNTHSSKFIADAIITCSPDFHADKVSKAQFLGRINGAIDALNKLDQVKKSLFYGRDNNLITEGQGDVSYLPALVHSDLDTASDIIHAILGMATEAGELLEALRAAYNGDPLDWVNIQEELGDSDWYKALLANRGDFTFEDVEQRIILKLRSRYAEKFSAAEANNRNLETERAILEGDDMQDEGDLLVRGITGPTEPLNIKESLAAGEAVNLKPTPPASGKEAVEAVEAASDEAFRQVDTHKDSVGIDAPATQGGQGFELDKFPGARLHKLPGEELAHQPVRPEDIK